MKKIAVFVIIILAITTVLAGARTISTNHRLRTEWEDTREVITVRVHYGDSLDKFGYQYKPTWMDIREYRKLVIDLNDMTSAMVYANTDLKLYVQGGTQ